MRSSWTGNWTTCESVFIVHLPRAWENLPVVPRAPKMRVGRATMNSRSARGQARALKEPPDTAARMLEEVESPPGRSEQVEQPQETARRLQQQHIGVRLSVCCRGFCSVGDVEIEIDSSV